MLGDVVDQHLRVQSHRLADQVQLMAVGHEQWAFQGGIEGEGRGQRHPQSPATGGGHETVAVGEQQVDQAAVLDHHPFGDPGGSRGVDDVCRVRRCERAAPVAVSGIGRGAAPQLRTGPRIVHRHYGRVAVGWRVAARPGRGRGRGRGRQG